MAKLIDIVAKHYKEWPKNAFVISQASDGEMTIEFSKEPYDWKHDGVFLQLASDYVSGEVTKQEWQEARNKLKEKKPNKDGWTRHRGGKCPVEKGTLIDVRYRDGVVTIGVPAMSRERKEGLNRYAIDWCHEIKTSTDIMAWRPHQQERPTEADPRVIEAKSKAEVDVIELRDEALKLLKECEDIHTKYEENINRISEIHIQLGKEGFALIDAEVVKSADQEITVGSKWTITTNKWPSVHPFGFITEVTGVYGEVIECTDAFGSPSRCSRVTFLETHKPA